MHGPSATFKARCCLCWRNESDRTLQAADGEAEGVAQGVKPSGVAPQKLGLNCYEVTHCRVPRRRAVVRRSVCVVRESLLCVCARVCVVGGGGKLSTNLSWNGRKAGQELRGALFLLD